MRILVMDDQEEMARAIAFRLIDMGHTAVFLTRSTTVPDTVYRFQPQIVFVDVGMAGMGGWKAAALLRVRCLGAESRIVALTPNEQLEDYIKSRKAGFDAHMVKPPSISALHATIGMLFPASRKRKSNRRRSLSSLLGAESPQTPHDSPSTDGPVSHDVCQP